MRVSLEETEEDIQRHREDSDMNMEGELGTMNPQVKKHQRFLAINHQKPAERHGTVSALRPPKKPILPTS